MRPAGGVAADLAFRPCRMGAVERHFMHGSAQDACSRRHFGMHQATLSEALGRLCVCASECSGRLQTVN